MGIILLQRLSHKKKLNNVEYLTEVVAVYNRYVQ
jgi:hypothetical protein